MTLRAKKCLLVIVTGVLIAGCGSGDEGTIPSGDADNLINLLDAVEAAVAEQECESAQENADQFVIAVDNLPSEVDDQVKEGLRGAGDRLTELSRDPDQCEAETGASGESGIEETTTSSTVEEEPVVEEPVEEEPTTEEEDPEEEEAPEEEAPEEPGGGPPADPGAGNAGPGPGAGSPPGLDVGPGTDSGGIGPGERRAP
jgi:hypothetical protein